MDNLRLEHPATYSTHSQAGIHHLLPFTPPSIEFSPQLSRPSINNAQQNSIPFSTSWASLLTEPQYAQNSNALLKHGMQSPDRAIRTWDFTADSTLQHKQETSVDIAAEFPHYSSASLEEFSRESPNLQLKHGKDVIATEFGHLNASMDVLRGDACNFLSDNAVNDSRKDGFHLPGLLVAVDKGDASPLSVVSGVQPASFACKADPSTGRDHMFMSIDWHDRDDSVRALKETPVIMKTERVGESSIGLIESFKGSHDKDCSDIDERGIIVKKEQDAGVTIASLEDGSIGLRLGKRTYYGDGGGGGEESSRRAHNSSTHENGTGAKNGNSSNSSIVSFTTTTHAAVTATATGNINPVAHTVTTVKNNSGGVVLSKKQKGSSAFTAVPMCQAEGCTADLSGAKDYHRRHKVCEWHSKASKTKVNNLEQRFCQQCSRFHILSAFDEGKRSCRRRLAGHNERRRKPPPEPMPLLTPGGFAYFADGRVNALHEHPYFLQHGRPSIAPCSMDNPVLACQLGRAGFPKQEIAGSHRALELHRYMQGLPPGAGSGVGALDDGGTLMLANGDSVALPTALSLPARASFSSVGLLPHVSSEMAISGRALSLLSPSLGSPETMSISLGMTTTSIDQILLDTHPLTASCQQLVPKSNQCFSSGIGMLSALRGHSQRQNHTLNSLTSSSSGCSTEIDQGERSMSNFEGRSLFLADSDNSFKTMQDCGNSHNGRPMLNLMQISPESSHRHHQQQQPDFPYVDLTGLSIFNRQNIM